MRASDLIRELQAEIGVYGDREVLIEFEHGRYFSGADTSPVVRIKTDQDHFLLSSLL